MVRGNVFRWVVLNPALFRVFSISLNVIQKFDGELLKHNLRASSKVVCVSIAIQQTEQV